KVGRGYDHCWILTKEAELLRQGMAAMAYEPESGRVLEILTDEIAVQFYCGNFLDGTVRGKEGKAYGFRSAFCLETQRLPDSPNHRNFPSTNLAP
ncbi:aldose epimerase family protein, partial [Staphylococcus aureus]